jgi:hypothetical protein
MRRLRPSYVNVAKLIVAKDFAKAIKFDIRVRKLDDMIKKMIYEINQIKEIQNES